MQERYTKQAENVLALAKEAASSCGHSYIGTEHLLVGLVEEKEGTATAGGGAVEVTVSGKHEVTKIKLSEEVVDPDDIEMLEDLILSLIHI